MSKRCTSTVFKNLLFLATISLFNFYTDERCKMLQKNCKYFAVYYYSFYRTNIQLVLGNDIIR